MKDDTMTIPEPAVQPESAPSIEPVTEFPPSPAELRARRWLITGLVVAALFLLSIILLLVFLSLDAYQSAMAGTGPSPGEVVVSLVRDAAIIFVAFETLLIGVLMIILMIQVQSLITLLQDEIEPMLEAVNETLATVRGTTQFVSHNVVSPVVKWSGYVAGVQRVVREFTGLFKGQE
ncbi:MAG TPA: hypothetical protein ENN99_08150 [Chloroflexi bacterium]|nr:hypothetical protein [Chloroflexota bacterium]